MVSSRGGLMLSNSLDIWAGVARIYCNIGEEYQAKSKVCCKIGNQTFLVFSSICGIFVGLSPEEK